MSKIISPNRGISLPNGLAEHREQERIEALIPLAQDEEKKAHTDFVTFLEEHNVDFKVYIDKRSTDQGERVTKQGVIFLSNLRFSKEKQKVQ